MDRNADLELKEMFRTLYPQLAEGELERARINFDRFLALVVRIADRDAPLIDDRDGGAVP